MFLKVTDEYFAVHKTTPNEPSPVCQSFLALLAGCLVSYRPLAVMSSSVALPLSPNIRGHTALLEISCD